MLEWLIKHWKLLFVILILCLLALAGLAIYGVLR
jgi:hypothetical protein